MTVDPGAPGTPMSERMQSLLSRAVEDQLSEQRQLAGVLADLRGQLQRIATDVAELRGAQNGGPSVDVSEAMLASVSADVREAVRLLGERLDGVARLVQQRGQDLAELRASVADLQTAVRGQGEALTGVTSGLAALPAFGERIGGLQDNLAGLQTRLAALDEMSGTADVVNQRVEHLSQELRELRSAFAGIGARIAELPSRADLGTTVSSASTQSAAPLADIAERLSGVEAALPPLGDQVRAVADRLAEPPAADPEESARFDRLAASVRDSAQASAERLSAVEDRLAEVVAGLAPAEPGAAEPEEPAEPAEDPVLAELAELWEALFGEEGLAAKVEAAEDVDARVATAVEQAVSSAETRLAAHIDEAVLALAEALLRRRTTRPVVTPRASEPPPPPLAAAAPAAEAETEVEAAAETDDEPGNETDNEPAAAAPAPWQTPPGSPSSPGAAESEEHGSEDADRRRRPWWRPGD